MDYVVLAQRSSIRPIKPAPSRPPFSYSSVIRCYWHTALSMKGKKFVQLCCNNERKRTRLLATMFTSRLSPVRSMMSTKLPLFASFLAHMTIAAANGTPDFIPAKYLQMNSMDLTYNISLPIRLGNLAKRQSCPSGFFSCPGLNACCPSGSSCCSSSTGITDGIFIFDNFCCQANGISWRLL